MKEILPCSILLTLVSCHGYVDPDTIPEGPSGEVEDSAVVLNSGFARKMVAMQFTSVGCVNCPFLASALDDIVKVHPDIIPVAFHMDYGDYTDPMKLPLNSKFYEKVNTGDGMALPLFALDFRKSSQHIINEYSKIDSEIRLQSSLYPALCGVAVETSYDVSQRSLEVTARFKTDVSGYYRYHIFLVEDGLEYSQAGAEEDDYIHDNVLRLVSGDNVLGTKINSGSELEAGKEYVEKKNMSVLPEWNPERMRVVVMILDSKDDGETWCCNNAAQCGLGESVDYAYAGVEKVESLFQRHVCVMEFTGTWCSQCPAGATTLNYLVERQYKGKAFALAFHNDDVYAIPQEQELFSIFSWDGYPAYVTDMRDVGLLNEGGCRLSIEKSLEESVTHCGVGVECVYDVQTATARVNAKVFSELTSDYRVAAYVVEDKVIGEQTEATGTIRKDYIHRHVVRSMLSSDVRGDSVGEVVSGTESKKAYTFTVDEEWDLDNLSVAVLAINKDGQVNNMAVCSVNGGKMEYEFK